MIRALWLLLGGIAVALAAIGLVLPVMPTVPFLLVATFAFARSSRRMHLWILRHPIYGPPIRDWRAHGRIARRIKVLACASMATGFGIALLLGLPAWVLAVQGAAMVTVATYLITRPE